MNYSENFNDFIYWYTSLVHKQKRKIYFHEVTNHHEGTLSDDSKQINYPDRDRETGEYVDRKLDLDKHLYGIVQPYIKNPTTKIIPDISIEEDLPKLLTSLRLTNQKIRDQNLHKAFPGYSSAIQKLGETLSEIQKNSKPKKSGITFGRSYGTKTQKVQNLKPLADEIIDTEDHDEAIRLLQNKYEDFSWDRPLRQLFKQSGKPNFSQISHALNLIAKIKWSSEIPDSETIRTVLFKSR